ncbi:MULTISPECIES: transcription/translation regulatory transformer protein RfaH [unclassified Pseudomonas]|jgi:transcriptional antiterminator RfaH|uniref:transcription/translation regulatory transformer protein RfaH n=1 Tax=unclassified Pseudomonas TaxID=196821 RepID=UPI0008F27EA9|nr:MULTISPECIES: transcription/translation regulatory transformer protein RfaH [unclassified Pseudomonas]SFH29047.1 transcriptional antiterminator RfaH [Pseudomonas sp. NFACC45]SIS11469.1 transcriptional antiterminator RfaH [Pseudomonas sp. A214]
MIQTRNWYLVQCKPRQDERAEDNLSRQGYECARPTCRRERIVRGQRQTSIESLFPGYLFIQMSNEASWAPLRSTRGIARVVAFGGQPLRVADDLIYQLQQRSESEVKKIFNVGDNVRILDSGLSEIDAVFMAMEGEERVILLINMLNRQRQISVPLANIVSA